MITTLLFSLMAMAGLFLLCRAGWNFFPPFYPEVKEVLGPTLFGYNWKTHLTHILLFPVAAAALAWVCTLF